MKNRTGELRVGIAVLLAKFNGGLNYHELVNYRQTSYLLLANQILKVCKDKGLRFVVFGKPGVYPIIEEIEIEENTD